MEDIYCRDIIDWTIDVTGTQKKKMVSQKSHRCLHDTDRGNLMEESLVFKRIGGFKNELLQFDLEKKGFIA